MNKISQMGMVKSAMESGRGRKVAKAVSGMSRKKKIGLGIGAGALALNAGIGPSGSRSTARNGIRPQSTGGYA